MAEFIPPKVIDEEILLEPEKHLMSKYDKFGIFEFANEPFMKVSGYEEEELMGKSLFCVQHPEMPELLFKMMYERLLKKEEFHFIVKNIAKNGKYYWTTTYFSFKINPEDGEILSIYSKRIATSKKAKEYFSNLYKVLVKIENKSGIQAAERYLFGLLEEKQLNISQLVLSFSEDSHQGNKEKLQTIIPPKKVEFNKNDTPPIKLKENREKSKQEKTDTKNSFFQRFFGKTDEEIEEEKQRRERK